METTLSVLKSIRGLYAASQRVDRDEFGEFVNSLDVSNEVQALEWIPRVPHSQRSEIERRARQDGLERFRIIERKTQGLMAPAGIREEYFPVYYVEPRRGNEAAIGYDLASNPTRKQALDQARDSGEMTATGRITLVQETGLQFGFLTFVPIYGKGQPVGTVSERRRSLIGFGLGVFRLGNLVDAAIDPLISQKSFISIQIHDDGAAPNARLIYPAAAPRTISSPMATLVPVERSIDVGGRKWTITATTTGNAALSSFHWVPWTVLIIGLLLTWFMTLYLASLISRRSYAEHEVRQRTRELRTTNEELKRSNFELAQFASVASHDLQEPLRKVQAFGDRLKTRYAEVLDDQGQDYLTRMQLAASRMEMLISDLLAFSSVNTNADSFVPIDLRGIVADVRSDMEVNIEEAGAQLKIGELPTIEADPSQMRQLFQNLIGNALKYRKPDIPSIIEISADIVEQHEEAVGGPKAQMCQIRISDNGIGFKPEYADRIFGIFQRLHGRTHSKGSGIGLAICRKIAERHGGSIIAEGRPDEGATFRVALPCTQAYDKEAA